MPSPPVRSSPNQRLQFPQTSDHDPTEVFDIFEHSLDVATQYECHIPVEKGCQTQSPCRGLGNLGIMTGLCKLITSHVPLNRQQPQRHTMIKVQAQYSFCLVPKLRGLESQSQIKPSQCSRMKSLTVEPPWTRNLILASKACTTTVRATKTVVMNMLVEYLAVLARGVMLHTCGIVRAEDADSLVCAGMPTTSSERN